MKTTQEKLIDILTDKVLAQPDEPSLDDAQRIRYVKKSLPEIIEAMVLAYNLGVEAAILANDK